MKIAAKTNESEIATVYIGEFEENKFVEFVESVQPPVPIEEKWVLIVSTLFGCPVKCKFCDAGSSYKGKLSKEQIFSQIDYMVEKRFGSKKVDIPKFKIQFARMGEPAFNHNVLDVLEEFPSRYDAPGFMPSISTVAPNNTDEFFERLLEIKKRLYSASFQMQFSIHSTDTDRRDFLIPVKKWDFDRIAEYGTRFHCKGGRKITLNFALAEGNTIDPKTLKKHFDPEIFIIKITPVNPTISAKENTIISSIFDNKIYIELVKSLQMEGFEVLLSIGELEENKIGSNCGQYISTYLNKECDIDEAYTYQLEKL